MSEMIDRLRDPIHLRSSTGTRRIARPSDPWHICDPLPASCRPMHTAALHLCTRKAAYKKPPVGRTRAESTTMLRHGPLIDGGRSHCPHRPAICDRAGDPWPDTGVAAPGAASPLRTALGAAARLVETAYASLSAKSPLAQAIQYALTRWTALTRYVEDGRIEIDNNAAERAIRALVLGRRNYLFAGSDAGGETAACLYSLIGTCRLNGIDPHGYLRHVLERIPAHPINRIEDLLPWRVAPLLPLALSRAA